VSENSHRRLCHRRSGEITLIERSMRSILDPLFRYTSSHQTDIRKTFARVRKEKRRTDRSTTRPDKRAADDAIAPRAQRKRVAHS